jgi:hypothetical protein
MTIEAIIMEISPNRTSWQPPDNYIPVASQVEGVTVYAPAPETPEPLEKVVYKCPNCGATTRYDIAAGGVACEYCGYQTGSPSKKVGKKAEEFEFTLNILEQSDQGWGVQRIELHCGSCGASNTLAKGALTATCAFCASNKVNVHPAPSDILRPRCLIPFKVQAEQVNKRVKEWLGQGWFHPAELGAAAVLDRLTGVYLPFWTFDADIRSKWKAEVGYEREERYYDHASKEWKSRTVIDWRWENGEVFLEVDDFLVSGSSRASRLILDRLAPYDLNELEAYNPDYLAGWQAQAYDVSLTDAWEYGKERLRDSARKACRDDIGSSHVRNFSMTADFTNERWRYMLLPVYLAAYRFEEKTYQVMANGQTGLVAGQKPVAWWKVWLAIAALLAPGLLSGLLGLPLLLAGGVGFFFLIFAAILLGLGGYFSYQIYQKAVESEAS